MDDARRKFIIDCDAGTDDAQAIMMALAQTDVDVIAVTCVFGNTTLPNVCRNVLRVLKCCNRLDIPVYNGCNKSVVGTPSPEIGYHGNDGLGDVLLPNIDPVDLSIIQKEHAANVIVRLANNHPNEITLVTLGPMTNLAIALHLDDTLGQKLQAVYTMGGNIEGKGNITPAAEFNIHCDPEAAYFVVHNLGKLIHIVAYEVCIRHNMSWEWYDKFSNTATQKANFVKNIEAKTVANDQNEFGVQRYTQIWDQLAVAVAVDPSMVQEFKDLYGSVELNGQLTKGQIVLDWRGRLQKPPNMRVILRADIERFQELLYSAILE